MVRDKIEKLLASTVFVLAGLALITVTFGIGIFRSPIGVLDLATAEGPVVLLILAMGLEGAFSTRPRATAKIQEWVGHGVRWLSEHSSRSFVLLGLFALLLFGAHLARFWSFEVNVFDHAFTFQSLTHPWGTPLLKCDLCFGGTYLAEHAAFPLLLLGSVFQLFPSETLLFLFQAGLVFGGVWILASAVRDARARVLLILLVVLSGPLKQGSLWDFREDHLGFFFFCIAGYGALTSRWVWLGFGVLLGIASKEYFPVFGALMSVAIWRGQGEATDPKYRRRIAVAVGLISIAYFGWLWLKFIPGMLGEQVSRHNLSTRLEIEGDTGAASLVRTLLVKPWIIAKLVLTHLFSRSGLLYAVNLIGPLAWLAWPRFRKSAWPWLLPVFAGFAMNLLPNNEIQRGFFHHYQLPILAFVFVAYAAALRESPGLSRRAEFWSLMVALLLSQRSPIYLLRERWPTAAQIASVAAVRDQGQNAECVVGDDFGVALLAGKSSIKVSDTCTNECACARKH